MTFQQDVIDSILLQNIGKQVRAQSWQVQRDYEPDDFASTNLPPWMPDSPNWDVPNRWTYDYWMWQIYP